MIDLRECEIQERLLFSSNRGEEKEFKKEICYFHKWYDGINKSTNLPEQFAIVELLQDGNILNISIERYNIRFLSQNEMTNKTIDKMFSKE